MRETSRTPPRRVVPALALGIALGASGAAAQEGPAESFGETLDVVVVEVEAVVTDASGRRVPGLGREDFRLVVDGVETAIEYFTEVREGRAVPPAAEGAIAAEPEAAAPGDPVATNYLLFVDDYFSIGKRRNWALEQVAGELGALPPQDRVAIVGFDGEVLEVLTAWTSSRERVRAALDQAAERRAFGLLRAHERARRGDQGPWSDAVTQREELDRVLSAIRSTLRVVPRPEGRKVLLLLAGSWPTRMTVPDWPDSGADSRPLPTGASDQARFDDLAMTVSLVDTANILGYTVYPVDVHGIRAAEGLQQEEDKPYTSGYTYELFRHGTLRGVAASTGGRALLFADRLRPLEAVVADTRTYYSLGFTPRLAKDGSRHEIRVEVRRPGHQVRSRGGFRDFSQGAELDQLAASALQLGAGSAPAGPAAEEPLAVELGEPRRQARGTMEVPFRLELPWSEVTRLPSPRGLVTRLQIRIAVRDREGALSEVARVPLDLILTGEPRGVLHWSADLTLRRERHDLVVSVYDALSGEVMTRVVRVEP